MVEAKREAPSGFEPRRTAVARLALWPFAARSSIDGSRRKT